MSKKTGSIEFANVSGFWVKVYAVDKGTENLIRELEPGKSIVQDSPEQMQWIVKDKQTGKQVGAITGKSGKQKLDINYTEAELGQNFLAGLQQPDESDGGSFA